MKKFYSVLILVILFGSSAGAVEESKKAAVEVAAPAPMPSEAAQKWKSLKAQEEWVARLKKQIQGETNQLNEMREALAQAFKLDSKKLEMGLYEFDDKSGKFVEKKPVA